MPRNTVEILRVRCLVSIWDLGATPRCINNLHKKRINHQLHAPWMGQVAVCRLSVYRQCGGLRSLNRHLWLSAFLTTGVDHFKERGSHQVTVC